MIDKEQFGRQLPDAVKGHWAETWIPAQFRPYMRLARFERPIGWWLLLLPCWWSGSLAATANPGTYPNLWNFALFFFGAIVMRGAGSAYNDILDRNIDGRVERTCMRPLPSGQVSLSQAIAFLVFLCLVGLLILLSYNRFAIMTGFASLGVVALYPLMKRVIWIPQAVLGLAFSWGALMGWAAHTGSLGLSPVLLCFCGVFWTIGYDTIYALQDIDDDEIAGVKSSALYFGRHVRFAIGICYSIAVVLLFASLFAAQASMLSYFGAVGFATHLCWQIFRMNRHDGELALKLFRSNRDAALILFAGLFLDALV